MKLFSSIILLSLLFHFVSCSNSGDKKEIDSNKLWIGSWQMTGYDNVSVEDSNIIQLMKLDASNKIEYISKTKDGEILMQNEGEYKINDQHSVLSIIEDGKVQTEYFIRKVDNDSLIFQDGKFSIKWKRID